MDKLTQKRLQREADRLIKSGKMPSLKDVCRAVLEARKSYASQIRRARREARGKEVVNFGERGHAHRASVAVSGGRVKHCLRSTGTERAWFNSPEEAAAFRETHPDYAEDVIVFCPKCGGLFHLSHPSWLASRPWETPIKDLKVS
jgi:hypothetical protein